MDFDKIQAVRDALVQSLTRWKGADGFYRSSPTFPSNSRPSFTNTGIVLQAYNESGNSYLAQPLADSLLLRLYEREYLPFPNEKSEIPHIMCNSWPIFSILDCYPSKVAQLHKLCQWFLDTQADNKSWYLVPHEPTSYPITTAYAISALLQFYDCYKRLSDPDHALLTTLRIHIEGAIGFLLSHRTALAKNDELYLWPASLDDPARHPISFSTSANCIHVIAKASRLLDNKQWADRTAGTIEAIVDAFAATQGDELTIGGHEMRLWDEVQMNEPSINYTWSFFAPINLTTVLRFIRDERFVRNERYYRFIAHLADWILTNHYGSDFEGVRGSKTLAQVRVWSTASSVIVLSRILAKRHELASLERIILDAETRGNPFADLIAVSLRDVETTTQETTRRVRIALTTSVVLLFAIAYVVLAAKMESYWSKMEGRWTLGVLVAGLIASVVGLNARRARNRLVGMVTRVVQASKLTWRIIRAVHGVKSQPTVATSSRKDATARDTAMTDERTS